MSLLSPSHYVFPERALQRWSRDNLRLHPRADGGLEATFWFEGSTCGNIAFELVYRVGVGPEPAGRRIESLACAPATHNDGHTRMCCWQEDAGAARALLERERPLLGEPLGAVLAWRPVRSPAGCLCAEPSRAHKWQAVLETLHFTLHHETRTRS